MRRLGRTLAKGLAALVAVAVAIELALQAIALVAPGRDTDWRPGATHRILCVGDSHTYGVGVRAEESYPAELQMFLDSAAPGAYSVVNRGVPGFNTSQIRRRLPGWIAELRPTLVVVLAGANNVWNLTDADDLTGWRQRLSSWALGLRVVRFVQTWRAHRAIDAERDFQGVPFGDRPKFSLGRDIVVDWGGERERIPLSARRSTSDADAVGRATRDYVEMARIAREHGVALLFLGYPAAHPTFLPFTTAMREVAAQEHCRFVDGATAVRRVPLPQMTWTPGLHAGPAGLKQIGLDVAVAIWSADAPGPNASPPNRN